MPIQGLLAPLGPRPTGRDTDLTMEHFGKILATMPVAPTLFMGEVPRKSPPIWRFINPRKHAQVIGMCVGRSACRMKELLVRIPEGASADSDPLPAVDMSSLYDYWIARAESKAEGVRVGAEGAIVSHSILASSKRGASPLSFWPDDPINEQKYSDRNKPSQAEFDAASKHLVSKYAILDTLDKHWQFLSQGYAIQTGLPITQGWGQTDDAGHFREAGQVIGGHATCTIGYDFDEGWVAILNSWAQWGKRSTDSMFSSTDGYTNIGYMPLEQYQAHFSDRNIQSGLVEAVVANTVDNFDQPKVTYDFARWYGGIDQPG